MQLFVNRKILHLRYFYVIIYMQKGGATWSQ
nr:MAG TPA: hypothetical protein [Caudoviricetes sp.]